MRIEKFDPADQRAAQACSEVMLAAHRADERVEPPMSAALFGHYLREGWEKTPGEVWLAYGDDGALVGFYRMTLPDLENLNRAQGGPTVHPAYRRRGLGRELLRHEAERAAANGRTIFSSMTIAGSAGQAFAEAAGARLDMDEVRRIQYLHKIAPGVLASLRSSAAEAAAGYSLVHWIGAIPAERAAAAAEVLNAFADAPHGETEEPEFWDADRVMERTGRAVRAGLIRGYTVAALRDDTGEMAGFTEMLVDPDTPQWGFQQLTAVTRANRGHSLGLLLKTSMLELLAEREPQLEWVQTGNAAANEHMIAVNEALGYEVVEPGWRFYEIPVADIR